MYGLLLKFNHIQPGFHRSCVMENILYIDAQIYESMLYTVFDCVSTVNDVLVYLIDYLFVYVWAFTQVHSYSTGSSPVVRHEKYPIHWRSDLEIDVVQSIWMRICCQWCVSVLNRLSICLCTGFYSNSFIFNRVFAGRASWKISYILMLRSTHRCRTQHLIAYLLSMTCVYT